MSRRRAGWVAWSLFATCVAVSAVGVLLLALVPAESRQRDGESFALSVAFVLVMLVFALVGGIVASRMPGNPIGWLFLSLGGIESAYELANGYAHYSLGVSTLPAAAYAAWFAEWSSPLSPPVIALAALLFPNGQLLSWRWRPVAWFCVLADIPVLAHYALRPGPLAGAPSIANPLGVDGASRLLKFEPDLFVLAILAGAAVAVLVRFHRSRGVERQQLKWFAWSAGLMTGLILISALVPEGADEGAASSAAGFIFAVFLGGLPVSAGLAILRYRLYDIDLVINRTLVYGGLTVLLAASYLGSVLILQLVLNPVTNESDLAVAGSTLAVAALFRPVRTRVQAVVDSRFYRARYDAARTLEGFASRLRDELDLETLGVDLRGVVRETMAPAHVSLWLRSQS